MSRGANGNSEEDAKVEELAALFKDRLSKRANKYCSDSCLRRFLRARNGSVKKAEKMLKDNISWRESFKPDEIRWGDVAKESETGKMYKADFVDKLGRTVLVMRPGRQNTYAPEGQIKQLVYFMENATLSGGEQQMVWLIDFNGWSLFRSPPVKTAKDIAHILQAYYPERLGLAILFNPPYIFETFWTVVKPFLDSTTAKKVKFVYSKDLKLMHELFDMSKVEAAFGGASNYRYNHQEYSRSMQQEDAHTDEFWGIHPGCNEQQQQQQDL